MAADTEQRSLAEALGSYHKALVTAGVPPLVADKIVEDAAVKAHTVLDVQLYDAIVEES